MSLIDDVIRAWEDKGSHPEYHDREMHRLRENWPTLYFALDALVMGKNTIHHKHFWEKTGETSTGEYTGILHHKCSCGLTSDVKVRMRSGSNHQHGKKDCRCRKRPIWVMDTWNRWEK